MSHLKHVTGISKFWSCRYTLCYLTFIGFMNVYILRVNLSVALIAMVRPEMKNATGSDECPSHTNVSTQSSSNVAKPSGGTYDWDRVLQGQILGSFFYGYICTQIPGGWLAGKYGGKKLFGFGVLCTAVFTLLTPLAAQLNSNVLILTRVLEGLGEGVTFPAMHAMWAVWIPPLERSKIIMLAVGGAQFGTVVGLPISGLVIQYLGWPYVFYIFGGLACLWFIFWMIFVHDSPDQHPRISDTEKSFIVSSLARENGHRIHSDITLKTTPWLKIWTSPAVWAIITAHFTHNWGFYTLLTCLPIYMRDVLQYDISKDSVLSALPYLFMWFSQWAAGILVDNIRKRGILSTTAVRKLSIAVGLLIAAVCLIGCGYVGCHYHVAVVLLCIAGTADGLSQTAIGVNQLDLSPRYASTILGITNMFATIPGFLAPVVVGWITSEQSDSATWRSVFYLSAEVYIFGVVIFTILGNGEEQPWSNNQLNIQQDNSQPSENTSLLTT